MELNYCNGEVLVFDADRKKVRLCRLGLSFYFLDWSTLRKTHRILGTLIGSTKTVRTLPLQLLPEEALLLLDRNLATVVERHTNITPHVQNECEQFEANLLEQQKVAYKNDRRRQLERMVDDIVNAKRKRGDQRTSEEILNDELEKSCKVTKDNMIWPILLTPIRDCIDIPRDEILKNTTELKYRTYKDLWEKGYYITCGHKFGADFLVYLGDPVAYHAIFIVRCVEDPNSAIYSSEIVAFGRLATAVKKRAVLASICPDTQLSYITINWIDA